MEGVSVPFCAQYVWQKHADDHKADYPLAAKVIKNSCYMEDLTLHWRRLKQQRRYDSSQPNLRIKQDFTFASGYLKSLKLSWTYLKLIEPQRWTLRGESSQLRRPGSSVDSSRREVLVLLCSNSRKIGINTEKHVEESCLCI